MISENKKISITRARFLGLHQIYDASALSVSEHDKFITMSVCLMVNCSTERSDCVFLSGNTVKTFSLCFYLDYARDDGQSLYQKVKWKSENKNTAKLISVLACPKNEEGMRLTLDVWQGSVHFSNINISCNKLREEKCLEIRRERSKRWNFVTLANNSGQRILSYFYFGYLEDQIFDKWNIIGNLHFSYMLDGFSIFDADTQFMYCFKDCIFKDNKFISIKADYDLKKVFLRDCYFFNNTLKSVSTSNVSHKIWTYETFFVSKCNDTGQTKVNQSQAQPQQHRTNVLDRIMRGSYL